MILQNKKTGKRETMTRAQYETLKQVGFAGGWMVISNKDEEPEKKVIPKDIIDFSQIKKKPNKKQNGSR